MRIALRCNALHVTTGYAVQAKLLADRMRQDGHTVAVFATYGMSGASLNVGGIPHYPGGRRQDGADVLPGHVAMFRPDLLITISDLMTVDYATIAGLGKDLGLRTWSLFPVDCHPLSVLDRAWLAASGARPLAMSWFGKQQLKDAGFDAPYLPHAVDTQAFRPPENWDARDATRAALGYQGKFVVAVNAANKESERKGWYELFAGFAAFHAKHSDSLLVLHTEEAPDVPMAGEGVAFDHAEYARLFGISGAVLGISPSDTYAYRTGMMTAQHLAGWYGAADVYCCTSVAEGFCVPLIEAAACGLPLIGADSSAVTEHVRGSGGWLIGTQGRGNPIHKRHWAVPLISDVTRQLERAWSMWRGPSRAAWIARQKRAREYALGFDADFIYDRDWKPQLAQLKEELDAR